jgi:predicted small secreted protein
MRALGWERSRRISELAGWRRSVLRSWRVVLMLCMALVVTACLAMREAGEDARKTEAAIKAELGVDAQINFRVFSGTAGKQLFVDVRLNTAPTGDAATVKTKVTTIVNRNFRSHVDEVKVSF